MTVIQRFGGGLNLNVHFHTLVLEGVFTATDDGGVRFHPLPAPTDEEVARVLATIATRVRRLLRRRGLEAEEGRDLPPDPLAEESGALAAVASASVQGRVALGARAGRRVLRLGRDPDAPWITSRGPRQAHLFRSGPSGHPGAFPAASGLRKAAVVPATATSQCYQRRIDDRTCGPGATTKRAVTTLDRHRS